ncbi:MAG: lysylphosphatidylglycerol synthase transmembrane domain-containing protein, partial [Myxococcota bacterium]
MKIAVATLISAVIGGVLLYLAAADLPMEQVWAYLSGVDRAQLGWALVVYGLLYGAVHALRMWRWSFLLRSVGEFQFGEVMRAAGIGFMAIVVLPLRLGELVRPYVLARETQVPMAAALGTAVVERVVDGLFITLLLFVTLGTYQGPEEATAFALPVGYVALTIFSAALGVCILALWRRSWTLQWITRLGQPISASLTTRVVGLLSTFLDGIQSLRDGGALGPFVAVTVAYWTLNGVSIALLARVGFGLSGMG